MNTNNAEALARWSARERVELLKSMANLPDPRRVAWRLPECALHALANAERGQHGQFRLRHGVRDMEAGQILFLSGLVEARGPYLGNFGMSVRKHAIALLFERDGD